MAVELDHPFSTLKPLDESYAAILDLERVGPCVQGGSVLERTAPNAVRQGHANASVVFELADGGGTIHTNAQITGKAASMGEGVLVGGPGRVDHGFHHEAG